MDAAKAAALATSKEDAVFSQDSKEMKTNKQDDTKMANVSEIKESAGSNQKKQQQQQPSNKINENLERESTKETDDLLEKIEEVVKGDTNLKSDVAISQASEQDFLKKIDEEMKESDKTTTTSTTNSKIISTNKTKSPIKGNYDSVDKSKLDGVIVNKEIFAIEDDNGVSSNVAEKNKEDNKKSQDNNEVKISKNIELEKNNKKQTEDISVSSTSNTNDQITNQLKKRHTNLDIFDEAIKRKVVEPIKPTKQDSNAQVTTTTSSNVNQLNKTFDTITKKLDNKSDLQTISSTLGGQIPMNVELIKSALTIVQQHKQQQQQQQQSLDLSLNKNEEEIMCIDIDSSDSSNDGQMDIDTEDKSEMDIDNGNGGDNVVVYNDTEMKKQEQKSQKNILEIQHKISPIKLQLDTGGNLNSPVKSFPQVTKENIPGITVKVNVDIGLTGNLNQSGNKEIDKTSVENLNKNSPVKIIDVTEKTTEIQKLKEQNETNKKENPEIISLISDEVKSSSVKEKSGITVSEKLPVKDKVELTTIKSPIKDKIETVTTVKSPAKETAKNTSISSTIRQKIHSIEQKQNIKKNILEKLDITKDNQQKIIKKSPEKSQHKDIVEIKVTDTSVKDSSISKISAPSTVTVANVAKVVNDEDDMKIENKILSKLKDAASKTPTPVSTKPESLTNSPIPPQANVFNSTPIVKQFEISSENVSKISDTLEHSTTNNSQNDQNVSVTAVATAEIISAEQTKQTTSSTSKTSETGSGYQTSETENQSSGVVSKFINSIKNGIADSTTDDGAAGTTGSDSKTIESASEANKINEEDNMYEVNLWCEKNDVKFLSVKRLDKTTTDVDASGGTAVPTTGQQSDSSNGSVSSLPQFSLPSQRSDTMATMTLSSCGSTESGEKTVDLTIASAIEVNKTKHLIKGLSELCVFMISHFTKIRSTLPGYRKEEDTEGDEIMEDIGTSARSKKRQLLTPSKSKTAATKRGSNRQQQRQSQSPAAVSDSSSPVSKEGRSSKMSCESPLSVGGKNVATANETPSRKTEGRTRKRSIGKMISDDDEEPKAKQAKKTQQQQQQQGQGDGLGQCVLAKWVDKKYYAGRILEAKPANKFVVRFEDGASKVLQKDLIVFGNDDGTLPLKDHKIHALVDDDYECGTVISIDKIDNKVLYTVKAETATVKVTASDIYLQDDQAKIIQNLQNSQQLESGGGGGIGGVSGALATAQDLSLDTSSRHTRHKRISGGSPITTVTTVSPEPGTSGGGGGKKSGRRQKRSKATETGLVRISESSDITDTSTKSSQSSEESDLEAIEGVQQEYQRTRQEIQDQRMIFIYEFRNLNLNYNVDELIGVLPTVKTLFKNKCFLLTCTVGLKPHLYSKLEQPSRNMQFSRIPFIRNFLEYQIIEGGGKIYTDFKDIPKSKYRSCILVAPRPCCTAKYLQCLAANIQAISHEWIIDCCRNNLLLKKNDYYLPAGWSIILNKFIRWTKGKTDDQRLNTQPFSDIYILIGSVHKQFILLWSHICKLAGAIIRYVKNLDDITPTTKGYMIVDFDFPDDIKRKAEYYDIPIVSSVWIVQSLIAGKILSPQSHIKLSCIYTEDDDM